MKYINIILVKIIIKSIIYNKINKSNNMQIVFYNKSDTQYCLNISNNMKILFYNKLATGYLAVK